MPIPFKQADLCPIFKNGDTMDVVNYRPVSILPSSSKVFEKEMVYQMSKYFVDLFNLYVSGFRKNHSCETVLIRMIENIKGSLD